MKAKSCIYEGHVTHRRFAPVPHSFAYPLFMMFIDLAELPHLFSGNPLWSPDRPNLAWFCRKDYLPPQSVPLDEAVRDLVAERTGTRPAGPVRILTHLRYFGHCFNPVSIYYCYDRAGDRVEQILAEVTNTPWGERHVYLLNNGDPGSRGKEKSYRLAKEFHVSPFMDMDTRYRWRFKDPGENLEVRMECYRDEQLFFDAALDLSREEIGRASLSRVLIRYPFLTLRVYAMIYLQAFRLWRKGVPFYVHPKKRTGKEDSHEQSDSRPHEV